MADETTIGENGTVAVRTMRHDDLTRVLEIDRAVGWRHDRERLQYLLEDEETRGLVAEREGVVAGFAFAGVREPAGWLGLVATDPAHQGHGVGTALSAAGDTFLRGHPDCDAALLEVDPGNPAAVAIYTRLGFVATGESMLCGAERGQAAPTAQPSGATGIYAVAPLADADWETLCALDDAYYGGWRAQDLLYWLSEGPELARLLRVDGQPQGYRLVERATGRIGPMAAQTLDGFLALLDDLLRADAFGEDAPPHVYLRIVDPDAAILAALAGRNLQPVPSRRNVRMEKVYRRPLRRLRGYYAAGRPEKG